MQPETSSPPAPTFREALRTCAKIGLLSFGGPTGQIALMHRILVDEKKWIDEGRFLNALNFCMLLPGPEATQLATYVGWRLHGLKGGLAAGLLFVLPGAAVVLALSMIYAAYGNVPVINALFLGIKAAVLVIVVEALLRVAKRALKTQAHWLIAAVAFVAIFFFKAPFPLIVLAAAIVGYLLSPSSPSDAAQPLPAVPLSQTASTIALWLAIWFAPLLATAATLGPDHVLAKLGWFFSKLAVVTFGGAYAVLAYMGQDVVEHHRWLTTGQMMDGLGLAETTPGPLILVTEYVGYLAAYQQAGNSSPILLGIAGAIITLWATFVPCYLWIFAGAPYIEWLNGQVKLKGALTGITAAVVGVILNLAVWFALHVFFSNQVHTINYGPLTLTVPTLSGLDWRIVVMAAVSAVALLRAHLAIATVLAIVSAMGVGFWLARL